MLGLCSEARVPNFGGKYYLTNKYKENTTQYGEHHRSRLGSACFAAERSAVCSSDESFPAARRALRASACLSSSFVTVAASAATWRASSVLRRVWECVLRYEPYKPFLTPEYTVI